MDSRVLAEVARGHGLVTARQLCHRGFDRRQVAAWARAGLLVPVWRGVYTTAELWESWDVYHHRPLARVRAVQLTVRLPHVFSHDSAAIAQRVPLLRPQESAVHVTRLHLRGTRTTTGIHHHGSSYQPGQVRTADGLPVLDIPRTVADIAREYGYRAGLVAADGAMQLGVDRGMMRKVVQQMAGWPASRTVAAVVEAADPGAESVGETLLREVLDELALGDIETQFPVRTARGTVWCDLRIGRHVYEFDGRVKTTAPEDGGVADRALARVVWDERRRQRDVCDMELGMSRVIYEEFWGDARDRLKARLRRDQADTDARYGRELTPEQAEFAARMRGRRYRADG